MNGDWSRNSPQLSWPVVLFIQRSNSLLLAKIPSLVPECLRSREYWANETLDGSLWLHSDVHFVESFWHNCSQRLYHTRKVQGRRVEIKGRIEEWNFNREIYFDTVPYVTKYCVRRSRSSNKSKIFDVLIHSGTREGIFAKSKELLLWMNRTTGHDSCGLFRDQSPLTYNDVIYWAAVM